MQQSKPLFMENEEWYYFDETEFRYKLTSKATEEARKSYDKFYELLELEEGQKEE